MQTTVELTAQTTICIPLNSNITSITWKGSLSAIWTEIPCMTLLRWSKITYENFPVSRNLKAIMAHARIQMIPLKGYLTLDPCHLYTTQPFGDTSLMIHHSISQI